MIENSLNVTTVIGTTEVSEGSCMDGARGARANLTFCEAFGCGHVYGLFSPGGLPPSRCSHYGHWP
jgi:hypothetical protein